MRRVVCDPNGTVGVRKSLFILFGLVLLMPGIGEAGSIKMAMKAWKSFGGSTSFTYSPSAPFDEIHCSICKVDTIDGTYRASLSTNRPAVGDSVTISAELIDHVYEDHAGAKDLKVAEVVISGSKTGTSQETELLRFDVLMDVPYYAEAINGLTGDSLGTAVFPTIPSSWQYIGQEIGTAASIPGYEFVGWSGLAVDLGCVRDPSASRVVFYPYCYFIMMGTTTQCRLYANYISLDRALSISSAGGGSVTTPGEGSYSYLKGSVVAVEAVADERFRFTGWSGTAALASKVADPGAASTTVTMDGDYTLIANFIIYQFGLTVSSTAGGSVTTPGEGVFSYDRHSSVAVAAVAESGYGFTGWTGTAVDIGVVADPHSPSTSVIVNMDCTLQANFGLRQRTLKVSSTEGGSVSSPGVGTFQYADGQQVALEARAYAGYDFVGWSGSFSSSRNPTSLTMNADHEVTAVFAPASYVLAISSTDGGRVVLPGEGDVACSPGASVRVVAVPDGGYRFAGWSGALVDSGGVERPFDSRIDVDVLADSTLRATFIATASVYVDDDSPNDPSPDDPAASDPDENGTRDHPFDTIQEAIDAANDGEAVLIEPGTYHESIRFRGKGIVVSSLDPRGIGGISQTVIDGSGLGSVVTFDGGDDANSVLAGLTIVGGLAEVGGGIRCAGADPVIANCIIAGNRADVGAGLWLHESEATIVNCTIVDNVGIVDGGGLYCDSGAAVLSSILWDNSPQQVVAALPGKLSVACSDVQGGWAGNGNLDVNPCFAVPGYWAMTGDLVSLTDLGDSRAVWVLGDCHLRSVHGRWEPMQSAWIQDLDSSPCIDAGDPNADCRAELSPNGGRINCGAYGGTVEASLSAPGALNP